MSDNDEQLGNEACATLRRGLSRTRKLAVEARHRLSELTSETVYPGPAEFILADSSAIDDSGLIEPNGEAPRPRPGLRPRLGRHPKVRALSSIVPAALRPPS